MQTFRESDLWLTFDAAWEVKQYDSHHFYKGISGVGMRAVDFICLHRVQEKIVLVEVKNFRNRPEQQLKNTLNKISGCHPSLAKAVCEKVQQTLQGINAIATYLNKYWWNRLRLTWTKRSYWKQQFIQHDRLYWLLVHQSLQRQPSSVEVILVLDLPDQFAAYKENIEGYLEQNLAFPITVLSSDRLGEGKSNGVVKILSS